MRKFMLVAAAALASMATLTATATAQTPVEVHDPSTGEQCYYVAVIAGQVSGGCESRKVANDLVDLGYELPPSWGGGWMHTDSGGLAFDVNVGSYGDIYISNIAFTGWASAASACRGSEPWTGEIMRTPAGDLEADVDICYSHMFGTADGNVTFRLDDGDAWTALIADRQVVGGGTHGPTFEGHFVGGSPLQVIDAQ
ncbi:MAG TPA: hypothetical protein VHF88_07405 [Thermoleophilaceae bacterium]|nr:hypothetical protein [Thermoleophilaceae bacterium]